MKQQSLFGSPDAYGDLPPAQAHSETSVAAAAVIKPHVNELQKRILNRLHFVGSRGCTDEELQVEFTNANTERPRRIELVRMGLVKDSGRTRETSSGRKATVWVLA